MNRLNEEHMHVAQNHLFFKIGAESKQRADYLTFIWVRPKDAILPLNRLLNEPQRKETAIRQLLQSNCIPIKIIIY